jgi:SAM-dependent methyltransferase
MNTHQPRTSSSVEQQQQRRYDESYFALYRDDPNRLAMYRAERSRIEKLKPAGRILDVGCGLGGFLAQFPPDRWERYGVDVAEIAIREARARGIRVNDFDRAYDYPDEFFDVIVLRGSLQLIPTPFAVLQECIRLLAPGGVLALLSTPNSNSPYYRRFGTLPFLTPHANFLIPSDIMMRDALRNFGLDLVEIRYPYLDTPYARPLRDHLYYLLSFFGVKRKFAFWRSAMEVYARKPARSDV